MKNYIFLIVLVIFLGGCGEKVKKDETEGKTGEVTATKDLLTKFSRESDEIVDRRNQVTTEMSMQQRQFLQEILMETKYADQAPVLVEYFLGNKESTNAFIMDFNHLQHQAYNMMKDGKSPEEITKEWDKNMSNLKQRLEDFRKESEKSKEDLKNIRNEQGTPMPERPVPGAERPKPE